MPGTPTGNEVWPDSSFKRRGSNVQGFASNDQFHQGRAQIVMKRHRDASIETAVCDAGLPEEFARRLIADPIWLDGTEEVLPSRPAQRKR